MLTRTYGAIKKENSIYVNLLHLRGGLWTASQFLQVPVPDAAIRSDKTFSLLGNAMRPRSNTRFAWCIALAVCLLTPALAFSMSKCLFVSSYHQGYAWSDGVERGVREVLDGQCELRQFDMDTKRNKDVSFMRAQSLAVRKLIEDWRPDVVITADDNAARYLVMEHFRDAEVPFVFCGVNWSVSEYEFPYANVTGMIEVAPIRPMLQQAIDLTGENSALYLGANTATEKKNVSRFEKAAKRIGLKLEVRHVDSLKDWIAEYTAAQSRGFVILGSHAGINDWNSDAAFNAALPVTRRLSVTNHGWMMPVTALGFTKVPEEHGNWAARTALAIIGGTSPEEIPIVSNRLWDLWVNEDLLNQSKVALPGQMHRRAKKHLAKN